MQVGVGTENADTVHSRRLKNIEIANICKLLRVKLQNFCHKTVLKFHIKNEWQFVSNTKQLFDDKP